MSRIAEYGEPSYSVILLSPKNMHDTVVIKFSRKSWLAISSGVPIMVAELVFHLLLFFLAQANERKAHCSGSVYVVYHKHG